MKRVAPVRDYGADDYPSVIDTELDRLSRRSFLRRTLSTAAAAGALVAGGGDASWAGKKRPRRYKTTLDIGRYSFPHSSYVIARIVVQSHSESLIRFLSDKKRRKPVRKVVRQILDAHSCHDVSKTSGRLRLGIRVAKALRALYRRHTRRRVARPTVALFVGIDPKYQRCYGFCPPPTLWCSAPKKRRPRLRK